MVAEHIESPLNLLRSKFEEIVPRALWPQEKISKREMSQALFGRKDASLRELAEELGVVISDERGGGFHPAQVVFAIDVFEKSVVRRFPSVDSAFHSVMMSNYLHVINRLIEEQLAFSLQGRWVFFSYSRFVGDIEPRFDHFLNLPRFRKFLFDLGYEVGFDTSINELRGLLGFDPGTKLRTMMESFFMVYVKKGGCKARETVYVQIVSRQHVSRRMSMSQAARELNIFSSNVRDYINRSVYFKYRGEEHSFFILAEE